MEVYIWKVDHGTANLVAHYNRAACNGRHMKIVLREWLNQNPKRRENASSYFATHHDIVRGDELVA